MASKGKTILVNDIKLTNKEFSFADAILRGLGNIEAAKEAGYKCTTDQAFGVQAQRLLKSASVKEYIRVETELRELNRRKKIEVDDLWITEQFKEIYNRCMQRQPVMRYDREAGQMIQETDADGEGVWTFDSTGANRALENIAKHIGYYELDNKQRAPVIQVAIVNNYNNHADDEDEGDDVDGKQLTEASDPS